VSQIYKNLDFEETIYALTTGQLPSAVAIVKMAGPAAFDIAQKIFSPSAEAFTRKRGMWFGVLRDFENYPLDQMLTLSFVAPDSHTGEDTVEFHCHGSVAVIQRLMESLAHLGARPATRGEFSYRALLNGKQTVRDLENLGDIFQARQTADLKKLYERKDGLLEKKIGELRKALVGMQAVLDTAVDFSEEYPELAHQTLEIIDQVSRECSSISRSYRRFREESKVPRLVIAGSPNAGKSSLFNLLLGRYRAIVSSEAGTTRDAIEEEIVLTGHRWRLVDTAGIRETLNDLEREGIEMGGAFLSAAEFWILVVDGSLGLSESDAALLAKFGEKPHFILWNKCDHKNIKGVEGMLRSQVIRASVLNGDNVDEIWRALEEASVSHYRIESGPLPTSIQAGRLDSVAQDLKELRTTGDTFRGES
jgi:tRNA modification GTPase